MLVKFKTLKELRKKLTAIPEEKRKVIVLVGRHLNEGTYQIAVKHHDAWEKEGAVAVQIPPGWTPQGFWQGIVRKDNSRKFLDSLDRLGNAGRWIKKQYLGHLLKKIPDDNKIVDYLATSGFEVPVVNFHANPTELTGHREGLHLSANTHNSRISNGPAVDALGGITPDLVTIHPCSLLAEYYFRPLKYASQSIYSSLHRHTKNLKLNELASRKGPQLSPKYLTDRQFTQAMLLKFNEQYSAPFNSLLRHLADNGLKSAKEVKT